MYTDTHCHLGLLFEGQDPTEVVQRAHEAGVTTMITVGVDLASSAECMHAASVYPGVYAAVGIHPNNAIEATEHVIKRLRNVAEHPRVVAIGETGLDWFREGAPRVRQEDSFRDHIRLAKDLDKTVVIHNRDADADVVAVLLDEHAPTRTVFHCFSGDRALVETCAENGWYVSFAGNLTFRNAPGLREAAAAAPLELLLTETDSPYLSPHPHRGQPNEPTRVKITVEQLAQLHDMDCAEMGRITSENARRAFRLPA